MPQNQPRRSEMWWRGHNDALAGDPPNESYYHYYYDYKLAYDKTRREQRRNQRQRALASLGRRFGIIGPATLLALGIAYGSWYLNRPTSTVVEIVPTPTSRPRPTPRPTLPAPTPTPEPVLRADGFAVITGTDGVVLRGRREPGTGANIPIVARFREGQVVQILEGPASADGLEWWRVTAEGAEAWAAAPYLVPVDPPASPEATPAP